MRGNVLQAGQIKGIVVCMMTVVAHQRAVVALWMIILAGTKAVINKQQYALLQACAQAVY